jgi:hypothetical protein
MTSDPTAQPQPGAGRRPRIRLRTLLLLAVIGAVIGVRTYRRRTMRRHADEFYATYGRP